MASSIHELAINHDSTLSEVEYTKPVQGVW